VGTGDGRAVLETAARQPTTLVLGMAATAGSMAEASRRAARSARMGGLPNAMFVLAAAESPPVELAGRASLVTVRFPWASLLRGVLGRDPGVAAGLAALVAERGELELLLAPAARDGLDDLPTHTEAVVAAASSAFHPLGFALVEGRAATAAEVADSGSTWARRLGGGRHLGTAEVGGRRDGPAADRSVTLVRLVRSGRQ
jgi:16S rRNA (adenine(1408)-N(1))-methyltransferase